MTDEAKCGEAITEEWLLANGAEQFVFMSPASVGTYGNSTMPGDCITCHKTAAIQITSKGRDGCTVSRRYCTEHAPALVSVQAAGALLRRNVDLTAQLAALQQQLATVTEERDEASKLLNRAVEILKSQPTPRNIVDVYDGTHSWLVELDRLVEEAEKIT